MRYLRHVKITIHIPPSAGSLLKSVRHIGWLPFANLLEFLPGLRKLRVQVSMGLLALIIVTAELVSILQPYFTPHAYALGPAAALLSPTDPVMAAKLHYNSAQKVFSFNQGYSPQPSNMLGLAGSEISASANQNARKGVTVTDPIHQTSFTMKPEFGLWQGKQDGNRLVYPLMNGATGWVVYTMHTIGVKEDVVLTASSGNTMILHYRLGLGSDLVARLESDGSIGIYGNSLLSGHVATGTAKDAALLAKARKNAPKNLLLFTIPPPTVKALDNKPNGVTAAYELHGDILEVKVSGLTHARYPLTIDPSIYVTTAQQFMNGNDETNIDFNVADSLIEKGKTTGARFNSWQATKQLNNSIWQQGVVAAGGFIYTVGGNYPNGSTTLFNTQGAAQYVVPSGITSITVKMWGAGGGGGGSSANYNGGDGGGGGFVQTTLTVTPGETLNAYVGAGGGGGSASNYSGGGGGGYSSLYRSSTPLAIAAGGAGGGGGSTAGRFGGGGSAGTAGGAAGGTNGVSGTNSGGGSYTGGGGGSQSSSGAGGSGGTTNGASGSSIQGGAGGDGNTGSQGGGGGGGSQGGGNGGAGVAAARWWQASTGGGGGGGGGYYGGGGGSTTNGNGGTGGGGGSSYASGTTTTNTAGSGTAPGNASDGQRNGAGQGGSGGSGGGDGSMGTNGLIVISAGSGSTNTSSISWAQFNPDNGTIQSANPGNGTCGGWCTTPLYDLPAARSNLSLVAYNGFLYAIGGEDSSCTSANGTGDNGICNTVYIAKLGANGEPRLWNPTSNDRSTWVYWYKDTGLTNPCSLSGAVAYENRLYLLGGKTSSSGTVSVTNAVQVANILPTGVLSSWSTGPTLPYNVYGHGVQIYNSNIYVIGGASSIGGAPLNTVYYNKINSDGTLNSWVQTASFASGRMTNGGNFTTSWGGYIYLSGGCTAVNSSGYCSNVAGDTQMASINADGSLDNWATNTSVSDPRMGHNVVAWNDYIYEIGGCTVQSGSTGACSTALNSINYGTINQDGDISSITQSVASGTTPCSGSNPYNCNLPSTSNIGQMMNATAMINGYLYIAGGCTNTYCFNVSGNTAYAAVSSDGTLTAPANCAADGNTLYGSWCVDSTHTINFGNNGFGRTGVAGAATAVFDNSIYFVGGINGNGLTNEIYYVSTNQDGSLNSNGWQYESMTTAGATSVAYEYAYARANPAAASTSPGNLYIFGGCSSMYFGTSCNSYTGAVYKCNIQVNGSVSGCTTAGQLQIGTVAGATGTGVGGMGGTVYANYIYLIGGTAPGVNALNTVYYAKLDNNNNVVAASGNSWALESSQIPAASQYAVAFGYNGYIYVIGGYNSTNGVLGAVQFAKINVSDGTIGTFVTSAASISPSWGMGLAVSNSYTFVVGGCSSGSPPFNCGGLQAAVQSFQVYNNDSGAPAGYSGAANTYTSAPNRLGASATVLNGYMYVAGGCTGTTDCAGATSTVTYAPLDPNGTVGVWQSAQGLPAARAWGKLEAAGGSLYYIGGQSGSTDAQAQIYYATPGSGGTITAWTPTTTNLPSPRTQFGAAVWNNRLYVVGGSSGNNTIHNTVYVSPQLNSGGNITGSWSTASPGFNVARSGLTVIAYANNLYILGGYTGSTYLSDVQYAQISTTDGSVGSWTYSTSLPQPLSQADGFAANGYIYLIGGRSAATTCTPITLVAPISANTTIASGNHPTGVGQWYQTSQSYGGNRYGAAAVYYQGKAYVVGGACGSTLSYASPVIAQTTILSEPQVAHYSIMFDTDSDVYPQKWLLNGLDNSIGAEWQLGYRSMTNLSTFCTSPAMTDWGQTTNVGNVTLGQPGIYTPLDSSGNNTNCARFFYLSISIDSSRAYGYPEDVSRGPTITDLTLEFTADPAKRLMHGRTFTGGIQQPDATPF